MIRQLRRDERGVSTALEMILAVAFILLPMFALLAQAPKWVSASTAATVAATEAAREVALADTLSGGEAAAAEIAARVVANHGFGAASLETVNVSGSFTRGGIVTATVSVRTHPIVIPGVGGVGEGFVITRSSSERVDDYRGFAP